MKKSFIFLLTIFLVLMFVACSDNSDKTPTDDSMGTISSTGDTSKPTGNKPTDTQVPPDTSVPPITQTTQPDTSTPLTTQPPTTDTPPATTPPVTSPSETESEEERMQKLIDYNKALDLLTDIDVFFTLDQVEAMDKAYQLLINLGDYKDVSKILSCFTMHTLKVNNNLDWKYISNQSGDLVAYFTNSAIYCTNTYDSNGNLIRVDYSDLKHKTEPHYRIYEYNDAGQLMRHEYINGERNIYCWTYEYTTDGNETIEYYKYNGVLQRTTTITYADGSVVKEYRDFGDSYQETTYTYDENGVKTGEITFLSSNQAVSRCTYEYDNNGNVIAERVTTEQGGKTYDSETTYTYSTVYIYTPPQG